MNTSLRKIGELLCLRRKSRGLTQEVVGLKPMIKANKNLIDYVMTSIIEFSKRHNLTIREASNYLNRFKGIDFLTEFYDVEHTLSFNDCVDDLTVVCQNNGGAIR